LLLLLLLLPGVGLSVAVPYFALVQWGRAAQLKWCTDGHGDGLLAVGSGAMVIDVVLA